MDVTRGQLAGALAGFHLEVRGKGGLAYSGEVANPELAARALYDQLAEDAARDDDPLEAPASVHVCCDHVPGSPASSELDVMDKIAGLLQHRTPRSRRRVLTWARDFLLDRDEPPF